MISWDQFLYVQYQHAHLTALPSHHPYIPPYFNYTIGLEFWGNFVNRSQILHNREDAEDAVHQAFVSIAKNIKKITEVDCPKTYGYIVITVERKSIDSLRANKHIISTDFEESEPGIEIPPPGEGGLADAIARLIPRYREVILLYYAYGYKTNELADMLGIKQDSVRRLLWRAKEALRKNLEEGGISV